MPRVLSLGDSLQRVEVRTDSSVTSGHWPGLNSIVTASLGGLHGGTPTEM